MQHAWEAEQPCPAALHAAGPQIPASAPGGLLHERPEQQSADAVHAKLCGEQSEGGRQRVAPPSGEAQMLEQHSPEAAQAIVVPSGENAILEIMLV